MSFVQIFPPPVSGGGGTPDDNSVTSAKIVDGAILAGDVADGTITLAKMAASASGAAAGTASLRALGTGATQACAGNDDRLSDARTPTAHAASHEDGGDDVITVSATMFDPGVPTFDQVNGALAGADDDIDVNGQKITSLATPTTSTDAATKGYVDGRVRIVSSGTATISASATVTLATITRNSTETFHSSIFCTNNTAGIQYNEGGSIVGSDGVNVWFEASANADEILFRARNNSSASSRTIDWKLIGTV